MAYLSTRPQQPEPADETKGQTAALFVSLYLVVLAFFILLNSISHIEMRKQTKAIGSVKDTFSIHPIDTQPKLRPVNQSGTDLPLQNYFTPIEKLAKSSIELVESRLSNDGNTLELTLPTDSVFFPYSEALKSNAENFLVRLAAILDSPERNQRMDLEAIFHVDLGFEESFGPQLSVKRANTLINMLSGLGIDRRNMFFGVTDSQKTHRFKMIFRQRDEYDATINERRQPAAPIDSRQDLDSLTEESDQPNA